MEMKINLNGKKRKILADAIGELLEVKAEYKSVPSFSYEIGEATLNRDNTLLLPVAMTPNMIHHLVDGLQSKGFVVEYLKMPHPPSLTEELRGSINRL